MEQDENTSNTQDHVAPPRDGRGRILPGHSLNLAGRPKGAIPSEAKRLRELIEPHREQLVEHLAKVAKGDDAAAVKASEILLAYLAARPRPTAELVYVEGLSSGKTLEEKCSAVLDAVASGQISSTAARELLSVLHDMSKVIEITDLERRLRALERGSDLA